MKNVKELLAQLDGFVVDGKTLVKKEGDLTVTVYGEEDDLFAVAITLDGDDVASATGIKRELLSQEISDLLELIR